MDKYLRIAGIVLALGAYLILMVDEKTNILTTYPELKYVVVIGILGGTLLFFLGIMNVWSNLYIRKYNFKEMRKTFKEIEEHNRKNKA